MADITGIVPGVRTIELHHPASESRMIGIRLQILSLDDDKLTKLKREFTDDYLRQRDRNKTQKAEQIEANSDRLMIAADALYPAYGFARHKGYGCAAHMDAIARLGPSPLHRMSFAPMRQMALL